MAINDITTKVWGDFWFFALGKVKNLEGCIGTKYLECEALECATNIVISTINKIMQYFFIMIERINIKMCSIQKTILRWHG